MSHANGRSAVLATLSKGSTKSALNMFLGSKKAPEIPTSGTAEKEPGRALANESSNGSVHAGALSRIGESRRERSGTGIATDSREELRSGNKLSGVAESIAGIESPEHAEHKTMGDASNLPELLRGDVEPALGSMAGRGASGVAGPKTARGEPGQAELRNAKEKPGNRESNTNTINPDRAAEQSVEGNPSLAKRCMSRKDPVLVTSSITVGVPKQFMPGTSDDIPSQAQFRTSGLAPKHPVSGTEGEVSAAAHPKREGTKPRWPKLLGSSDNSSSATSRTGEEESQRVTEETNGRKPG